MNTPSLNLRRIAVTFLLLGFLASGTDAGLFPFDDHNKDSNKEEHQKDHRADRKDKRNDDDGRTFDANDAAGLGMMIFHAVSHDDGPQGQAKVSHNDTDCPERYAKLLADLAELKKAADGLTDAIQERDADYAAANTAYQVLHLAILSEMQAEMQAQRYSNGGGGAQVVANAQAAVDKAQTAYNDALNKANEAQNDVGIWAKEYGEASVKYDEEVEAYYDHCPDYKKAPPFPHYEGSLKPPPLPGPSGGSSSPTGPTASTPGGDNGGKTGGSKPPTPTPKPGGSTAPTPTPNPGGSTPGNSTTTGNTTPGNNGKTDGGDKGKPGGNTTSGGDNGKTGGGDKGKTGGGNNGKTDGGDHGTTTDDNSKRVSPIPTIVPPHALGPSASPTVPPTLTTDDCAERLKKLLADIHALGDLVNLMAMLDQQIGDDYEDWDDMADDFSYTLLGAILSGGHDSELNATLAGYKAMMDKLHDKIEAEKAQFDAMQKEANDLLSAITKEAADYKRHCGGPVPELPVIIQMIPLGPGPVAAGHPLDNDCAELFAKARAAQVDSYLKSQKFWAASYALTAARDRVKELEAGVDQTSDNLDRAEGKYCMAYYNAHHSGGGTAQQTDDAWSGVEKARDAAKQAKDDLGKSQAYAQAVADEKAKDEAFHQAFEASQAASKAFDALKDQYEKHCGHYPYDEVNAGLEKQYGPMPTDPKDVVPVVGDLGGQVDENL